jgi:hypothetical protein
MDPNLLESKWSTIPLPAVGNYSFVFIDADCKPDLNIGLNSIGNRCLILSLPIGIKAEFFDQKLENISTKYNRDENILIIELTNNYLSSYFNDIIVSLYYKIKEEDDVTESTSIFIKTINEWCIFFTTRKDEKLDLDTIQGIIGELSVLNELLKNANSTSVNYFLNSWRGLYNDNNDFYLDDKNIEVKTKRDSKTSIKISSGYQLEEELDKQLELIVVSVELVSINGVTLYSLVEIIKHKILVNGGDLNILYTALKNKNLTFLNFKEYDCFNFQLISHTAYQVIDDLFPRLVHSKLSKSIVSLNYQLNLSNLNDFITYKKELNIL